LATWSCDGCQAITPPQPECKRTGCQWEKCVDPDAFVTLECAEYSPEFDCFKYTTCGKTNGTCGWIKTEEYTACLKNPSQTHTTDLCTARSPCSCIEDPLKGCGWCSAFDTLASGATLPWGVCMSATLAATKCLPPKTSGGLGGHFLSNSVCNDDATGQTPQVTDIVKRINSGSTETAVQKLIASTLANADADLKKFTIVLQTILQATVNRQQTALAVIRNFVTILGTSEPNAAELAKLCDLIASSFASNIGVRHDALVGCSLTKVQSDAAAATKRHALQTSSSIQYLHEVSVNSSQTSSSSSNDQIPIVPIAAGVGAGVFVIIVVIVVVVYARKRQESSEYAFRLL